MPRTTTFGQSLIEQAKVFATTLSKGESVAKKFTCRRVKLNLEPTPYSPALVKETRKIIAASQAMFAQFIGVTVQTVRAWEQGINTPNDMACRFMDEIRRNPSYWLERFKGELVSK